MIISLSDPMRLTDNQKKILAAAQLDARAPVSSVAKLTRLRQHVVRHTLDYLKGQQIITPYLAVNINNLGFDDYAVFIRRITESDKGRQALLRFLKGAPEVSWVAEVGGSFQYVMSVLARNFRDIDRFLSTLGSKVGETLQGRAIAPRVFWEIYPSKFLNPAAKPGTSALVSSSSGAACKVDSEDIGVLEALAKEPGAPYSELARQLRMPISSFQYRVARLTKEKILLGFAYHLNYSALDLRKYMLLVHERGVDPRFPQHFERFCRDHPAVTACHRTLADWSYEIDVHFESTRQLARFRQEVFERFGSSITQIESLEYLITHKLVQFPGCIKGS